MKKIKEKDKPNKAQDLVAKEIPKKMGKSQVVKLKAKKSRGFGWQSVMEFWNSSVQFVKEAWIELKKVTWPGQKETVGATAVVIVLVMLVSFYLGLVDFALSRMMKVFIG